MQLQRYVGKSLQRSPCQVSERTLRELSNGAFSWVGSVPRTPPSSKPNAPNPHILQFFEENGITPPFTHIHGVGSYAIELHSVKKYDKTYVHNPNLAAWSFAAFAMSAMFRPVMAGALELSQEEALADMDMTTSPGYPWNLRATNKTLLLRNPEVAEYMRTFYAQLGTPEARRPIWTSSVKSEVRDVFKVADGSMRTFTASAIEHTIGLNRACGDQNQLFYEAGSALTTWSRVGMSQFHGGWDAHIRLLMKPEGYDSTGWELDASQYDSSLSADMLRCVRDFRCECAEDDRHRNKIRALYHDIINSVIVLTNGDVVEKHMGNPSGSANTVVDNTLLLMFIISYCYYVLSPEKTSFSDMYALMVKLVSASLYGDDNTIIVHSSIQPWFNAKAMRDTAQQLGITLTADHWEPRPFHALGFLSHKTVYSPYQSMFVPHADPQKMLASLLHGTKCQSPEWAVMRANAISVEVFWHKSTYELVRKLINWLVRRSDFSDPSRVISGDITCGTISNSLFSERDILALYFSPELGGAAAAPLH